MIVQKKYNQIGALAVLTIIFASVFIMIASGILSLIIYQKKLAKVIEAKESALQIAEAGVNYYRWHLAHDIDDYADGTGDICVYPNACGPYQHDYYDPLGGKLGTFELYITPPDTGSTLVKIQSTGWVDGFEKQSRIIEVQYGIPSLATYSFLTNSDVWLGNSESVVGPLHSNGGIRMDGNNDSITTSAQSNYICTSGHGCNSSNCSNPCQWISGTGCECPGVWGTGPNSTLWQFPVPPVDFNAISLDMSQLKIDALNNGIYYDQSNEGYRLVFKNDSTIDIYQVTSLESPIWQLNDDWTAWITQSEEPDNQTFITNLPAPANGIIFIEDDVWVEGVINGRFTLVSAAFPEIPSTYTSITINDNITYLSRDGNNSLGIIAQKHVKVPKYAPDTLTIDAIMLAQNGRVFRNLYWPYVVQSDIIVYGGIITNNVWTWTWVNSNGNTVDGYDQTTSIYDNDAAFTPPPSFPNTGEYTFISWEEKIEGEL